MEAVVDIENLSRKFGKKVALDGVSLEIQPQRVYGLVGGNGHGKTTLIKHVLGLLRAQTGTVRVFGIDPVKEPASVLERCGYVSEHRDLPEWMRVGELLKYVAAFHPNWDSGYAAELVDMLGLDRSAKVKNLSKGMRAQTALIAAAAHRPELLVLDEPSTGLDAVVRKDILAVTVRSAAENGATVLFSSHLLNEVELMSDEIIMLERGRITLTESIDTLRENHFVVTAQAKMDTSEVARASVASGIEVLSRRQHAGVLSIVMKGDPSGLIERLTGIGCEQVTVRAASLEESFVARAGRDRVQSPEPELADAQ